MFGKLKILDVFGKSQKAATEGYFDQYQDKNAFYQCLNCRNAPDGMNDLVSEYFCSFEQENIQRAEMMKIQHCAAQVAKRIYTSDFHSL